MGKKKARRKQKIMAKLRLQFLEEIVNKAIAGGNTSNLDKIFGNYTF